jgi:protein-S-isoprenylcysteine O-methyltransferase Ste14
MSEETETGEKTLLIPPVWFLIFAVSIVAVGRALPGPVYLAPGRGIISMILALAGLGIAVWALVQFSREKTTYKPEVPSKATALVTDGVYRITRNPMYVGMALVLLGIAIGLGTILGLLLVPVFIGLLTAVQIVPEERALSRLFGDDYEAFKRRTPRWLFL